MGLDIYAHSKAVKISHSVFDEDGYPIDPVTHEPIEYDVRVYVNPDFPGRAEGLEDRAFYSTGDYFYCRYGYGSYNALRDELAKMVGYPEGEYKQYGMTHKSYCVACWDGAQGPFSEVINFSDCEGCIGPIVCRKLAEDFAKFQAQADAHENERFREFYANMRKAFEIGADSGLVKFS